MKTRLLAFIAVILLIIFVLILYFSSAETGLPIPTVEEPTIEEEVTKGTIYLGAKLVKDDTGTSVIQITAMHDSESPLLLSALSIKGVVMSDDNDLSVADEVFVLTPAEELENWLFVDDTAYSDSRGGVVVELNGLHQSEELYPLDGDVVLATIPLTTSPAQQVFTLKLDNEFTEFFGEDAKEEFIIEAK